MLTNGCISCTVNEDLEVTRLDLLRRIGSGEMPLPPNVIVETTGMADPFRIMRLLAGNGVLAERYTLDRIVTPMNSRHGYSQLENHPEALLQIAVADFILLSQDETSIEHDRALLLRREIVALNPIAKLFPDVDSFTAAKVSA